MFILNIYMNGMWRWRKKRKKGRKEEEGDEVMTETLIIILFNLLYWHSLLHKF